jgi:hypothetical protein
MWTVTDDPLAGLDQVPWQNLHHAYGPATDVPAHLSALRSPDPATRSRALDALTISVCHQGTRWEVSQQVVPFLIALIDATGTPDRGDIVHLLTRITIGDRRDDELPFDPAKAFARAAILDRDDTTALVNRFHLEEDDFTDEEITLLDAVSIRWAADCYHRCATFSPTIAHWLTDPDHEVAARAAALTAWFPPDPATINLWLNIPHDREQPRASANLALAHSPTTVTLTAAALAAGTPATGTAADSPPEAGSPTDAALRHMTATGSELVAVTAAVASAYRHGLEADPTAVSVLIDAADRETLRDVTGWTRATRGFVMRALHRLGL